MALPGLFCELLLLRSEMGFFAVQIPVPVCKGAIFNHHPPPRPPPAAAACKGQTTGVKVPCKAAPGPPRPAKPRVGREAGSVAEREGSPTCPREGRWHPSRNLRAATRPGAGFDQLPPAPADMSRCPLPSSVSPRPAAHGAAPRSVGAPAQLPAPSAASRRAPPLAPRVDTRFTLRARILSSTRPHRQCLLLFLSFFF